MSDIAQSDASGESSTAGTASSSTAFVWAAASALALVVVLVGSVELLWSGSSRSDLLALTPSPVVMTQAPSGETIIVEYGVRNTGKDAIKIIGAIAPCSCTVPEGLPMTLEPGEQKTLRVKLVVGSFDASGMFLKSLDLLVDRAGFVPTLTIKVRNASGA